MRIRRLSLLLAVALGALSHTSDGQQVRPLADQLKLAGVMPRGAMVYVQTRDLSAVMKQWLASPVRDRFYKSPSFTSFAGSRIYVKLQDRRADFEKAIGFGLGEDRLAELAGGQSAVSVYDIGKLELVFVTEMTRAQAVATSLFKQAPQFQERSSGDIPYYVRDVTTDGGRLNQQFCFAYAGGRLIVTTTEGLMIRALGNAKAAAADSLLADVLATSEHANGLATHDVTMWIDQVRLNQSRHFNSYWIYHNESKGAEDSLADIESGLLDLRFAADGMHEQRWFVLKADGAKDGAMVPEQASALMRFAPPNAQFVEVHGAPATGEDLGAAISRSLFGKLPDESTVGPQSADGSSLSSKSSDDHGGTERYSRLDTRFDVDVDDEHAPNLGSKAPPPPDALRKDSPGIDQDSRFAKAIAPVLSKLSPSGYCEMARSSLESGKPFARFEHAVVIELGSTSGLDRNALEPAITDELRARFVVSGAEPGLEWRDEASVRYLAQSLLEQGAAYSISGKYLILASNKEFARDILQAGSNKTSSATSVEGSANLFALVRVSEAKPVFDKLMSKLDGPAADSAAGNKDESKDDETKEETTKQEVKFFRDNLSSLIAASGIRELRLQREISGSVMVERVNYSW